MINKLILAGFVLMLAISLSFASDSLGVQEPSAVMTDSENEEIAQESVQDSRTANGSLFLEDFNRVNDPYKKTLFATGQGNRDDSINYYENLTVALTNFQEKYEEYRPTVIMSDKLFSGDMMNVSDIISGVKGDIYIGNLTEAHTQLEEVRPIFQNILSRNGLMPLSVALVDFHDVMEQVLEAANNKESSKVLEVYPMADEKLKAVESISSEPGIEVIRRNLDDIKTLAKEEKNAELPAKAVELKASYVKVYLAMN